MVGIPLEFSNAFSDTVAVEFIVIFLLECALEENRKTELHQGGTGINTSPRIREEFYLSGFAHARIIRGHK